MEIVADVVLGSGLVLLSISLLILARANSAVTPTLVSYGKDLVEANKNQMLAEAERDEWKAKAVKAQVGLSAANRQLVDTTERLNKVLEEDAHEAVENIRSAPTAAEALDVFNRLLQDVPEVSSPSSGGDKSGAGPSPVLSTKLA